MIPPGYDNGWPSSTAYNAWAVTTTSFSVTQVTQTAVASTSVIYESYYGAPQDNCAVREFLEALDRAKKRTIVLPLEPWSPAVVRERRPQLPRLPPPRIMRVQARGG